LENITGGLGCGFYGVVDFLDVPATAIDQPFAKRMRAISAARHSGLDVQAWTFRFLKARPRQSDRRKPRKARQMTTATMPMTHSG
jgi:hypothetical protein